MLTTHEGHFLGRARSHLIVWREAAGAFIRDVGAWDPLPPHLAAAYASAGRVAQQQFWGPEPETARCSPSSRSSPPGPERIGHITAPRCVLVVRGRIDETKETPCQRPANPRPAVDHGRRWLLLAIVGTVQLLVVLDATIVNIALPAAQRELGFADHDRQWVITAYALAFGSLLPLGGRVGDLFGRKWTVLIGLGGFAGASALWRGGGQSFAASW